MLAILAVALMPANEAPSIFASDKLNHMLAFFVLAASAKFLWPRTSVTVPFLLLAAYGGLIEILQALMGFGRDADWMDFGADVLAIGLGLLAGLAANAIKGRVTSNA